jgi:DNA polymerase
MNITDCRKCKLCDSRNNIVVGSGNEHADIMIIGEAPGATEDDMGIPFVGRSGNLLTKLLKKVGLDRGEV